MKKKLFWTIAGILNLLVTMFLPFFWSLVAVLPITFLSWWIVYRWLEL